MQEAAWTISNITAGNSVQIQLVIDAGCLAPLIDILIKGDFKVCTFSFILSLDTI